MQKIYLALGSNVGDARAHIESALVQLLEKVSGIECAPLYISKPLYHAEQASFINTVVSGTTSLLPEELLVFVKDVEKRVGRIERFRNGPREIDIDILFYDDMILNAENLVIPHPRIAERAFVLMPLADIAPDFVHPVLKKSSADLLGALSPEACSEVHLLP